MQVTTPFCSALTLYIEMGRGKNNRDGKKQEKMLLQIQGVYTYKQHAMTDSTTEKFHTGPIPHSSIFTCLYYRATNIQF